MSFVFLLASQCICQNRECVKRSAKSALSQSPVLRAGNCESAFFSLMLHQDIIYMPTILLQDLIYMIYIYMHTSKISSSWVTRNKTYCTCTARNYITLSTVLCHLASEYQREKFNFALLRHAQMIGFCLLLCCRFL